MSKEYTSNVEDKRLEFEEFYNTTGSVVTPSQIWRDSDFISGNPRMCSWIIEPATEQDSHTNSLNDVTDDSDVYKKFYYGFNDGASFIRVIERYEHVRLYPVDGTDKRVYYRKDTCSGANLLSNIIDRRFDRIETETDEIEPLDPSNWPNLKRTWHYVLHYAADELSTPTEIAFGVGEPAVDIAAGTLEFKNKTFLEQCKNGVFYIDFFKYVGRSGFIGSSNYPNSTEKTSYTGAGLPLRDDLPLIKSSKTDNVRATFVLDEKGFEHGEDKANFTYKLPQPKEKDGYAATLMTAESMNEVIWERGIVNGGYYGFNVDNVAIVRKEER